MNLYMAGTLVQSLAALDTDGTAIDSVRLGAMGIETGTRGTIFFDNYQSRRFSLIGALPDPGLHENSSTIFTYISQPNETLSADANLYTQYPTTNYGSSTAIFVGDSIYNDGTYHGLIKFDLSSIPSDAVVTSATLTFTVGVWDYYHANHHTMRVYRFQTDPGRNQVPPGTRMTVRTIGGVWMTGKPRISAVWVLRAPMRKERRRTFHLIRIKWKSGFQEALPTTDWWSKWIRSWTICLDWPHQATPPCLTGQNWSSSTPNLKRHRDWIQPGLIKPIPMCDEDHKQRRHQRHRDRRRG